MSDLENQTAEHGSLRRSVRLIDVVMLGAGTAIGASVFTVLGPATNAGGSGVLIATVLAAVPMAVFAIVYAFMSSTMPRTGASYEWQHAFVNPFLGFVVVWLRILGSGAVMVLLVRVLVEYLGMVWPGLPAAPIMLGLFIAVFALNYFGVSVAARAQTLLMLLLLAAFAVFVGAGAPRISTETIGPVFQGWGPILAALPVLISLFLGIETATEVGEEVENAERNVPVGLVLALSLTLVVYLSIVVTSLGVAGPRELADSDAPLLTAAEHTLGGWATPLIVSAAVLAIVKSLNASFLVFTRFLYAMGRNGALPGFMARVHPRWGTPHVATMVAFGFASLGLLLSKEILPLLLAVNIPAMMKYFGTCLAGFNVVRSHPDVYARARLRFRKAWVTTAAVAGMVAAVVITALGWAADWRPYAVCAAWTALGLAYWWLRRRRSTDGWRSSVSLPAS
ncbi:MULTISPECIES: amino acid permease [unclassified Streptomyces]|uniref:APC family permease n=1 Tax=unclassified Streptomyces TaxID=2593676 RepID=UPI002DD8EB7B|nr:MULTISPECIES: amino acid permease [unclassified Streptomyces]WSA92614.1 amino acid permease [Streptomyces sp. NBC_01795]WSB76980.1 amino acid permease [Streptomyces sp. NBC_01775]WSS43582.1 amino acid permease [Streptomyces sp. NBC_01187]